MTDRFKLLEREVALELDQLCDRFEDAFRAGENPVIEDYLEGMAEGAYRSGLAMLLELELDLRREQGELGVASSYFHRFPDHHDTILDVLDSQRDTQSDHDERGSFGLAASRLGRYEFAPGKPLGEGTFGKVYQAWDTRLRRNVAIKVPRPDKLDKDLFLREARAISQLKHANICTVYDVDEDEGRPYMVMELIEGPKLSERLSKERLSQGEAVRIVYEVAQALEHAHGQGIVHRDLKPANIMLRGGREPVVLDFGLAKVAAASETLMQENTALGTALYMPPEQATGDLAAVGPASDVYSLGMVLYEALTGELPFSGTMRSVLQQVKDRDVPDAATRCPEIPPGLASVCAKACAKVASDRYASMADFAAALRPYLPAGHRDYVEAAPAVAPAGRWRWIGLAAAAAATAAAIAIWIGWQPGEGGNPSGADQVIAGAGSGTAPTPVGPSIAANPPAESSTAPSDPSAGHAIGDREAGGELPSGGSLATGEGTRQNSGDPPVAAPSPEVEVAGSGSGGHSLPLTRPDGSQEPGTAALSPGEQLDALLEDLSRYSGDSEEELRPELIQRSIDLGLGIFRGTEEQRRAIREAWANRLRRRASEAAAADQEGDGQDMRPASPDGRQPSRPLQRIFGPKSR